MTARPSLLKALRRTLLSVTEAESTGSGDPLLADFKRSLVRMIAELELRESDQQESDAA